MTTHKSRRFPANPQIVTARYRGPDRRQEQVDEYEKIQTGLDASGNSILEIRVRTPRRRRDDHTVDLIKCLDWGSLSIEETDESQ